ncbi:MAG: formate--tetrahydrofolate ligase [Alistipes sp.]|nr:formate--tetrahydrofolate ligase [Alistipes sp.]MBP3551122.1 formate--tetrahydrofolate ligase [Alistipes sp.]
MKSDIEIARSVKLKNIREIAAQVGFPEDEVFNYGKYIAKIPYKLIDGKKVKKSHLILVTAITATKAGVGKTTVSIGLGMGLNHIGKRAVIALREPSLGPCFGMKGGATGGGYTQVLPSEDINLHFTGDFHAVTSANNLIAALLDNYLYHNRSKQVGLKKVMWRRVLDMNDRSLRHIVSGLGGSTNGIPTETGFDITPASEIMAILCLARNIDDLYARIGRIVLGVRYDDTPFTVEDLGVTGAVVALLKDAINPNLVQTTEHHPVIIHGGPFANIAHGCNSVIATRMAMSWSDYTVTEAGFGADLGAEKFYDIKCRQAGLKPDLTVLVASTLALKMHGGVPETEIKLPNAEGLKRGFANLDRHIANLQRFGQTVLVCFNRFASDTDEEIALVMEHCAEQGVRCVINNAYMEGSEGAAELAKAAVELIENQPSAPLNYAYDLEDSIMTKIEKVAKNIYGAGSVEFSLKAQKEIALIEKWGMGKLPICIAKTQYSFSGDAKQYGSVEGFTLKIKDIELNAGSGFVVVLAGDIMRMPGLSKTPQAVNIRLAEDGNVEGLV